MDFPLALPVRCREHRKRNWERCLGVAYHPLVQPVEIGFVPDTA
jgi:hypothetical protein